MALRNAAVLPILTVACLPACLAAASSSASAAGSSGSLSYAAGTTSTAGMIDVGMVFSTVAADLVGTNRSYRAYFPDTSAAGGASPPRVATMTLGQTTASGPAAYRFISADIPSSNIADVKTGAGVTAVVVNNPSLPNEVTTFGTGGGGWTPGRSYRLRVRQTARPSGGRRFRVSVTNVVTGGERVIVDFTRMSLTALSLRTFGDVYANSEGTCASLFDARASIDRPRGVRGSDGATIAADPSPAFFSATSASCPASQRRVSTDRIVIDLGR